MEVAKHSGLFSWINFTCSWNSWAWIPRLWIPLCLAFQVMPLLQTHLCYIGVNRSDASYCWIQAYLTVRSLDVWAVSKIRLQIMKLWWFSWCRTPCGCRYLLLWCTVIMELPSHRGEWLVFCIFLLTMSESCHIEHHLSFLGIHAWDVQVGRGDLSPAAYLCIQRVGASSKAAGIFYFSAIMELVL